MIKERATRVALVADWGRRSAVPSSAQVASRSHGACKWRFTFAGVLKPAVLDCLHELGLQCSHREERAWAGAC